MMHIIHRFNNYIVNFYNKLEDVERRFLYTSFIIILSNVISLLILDAYYGHMHLIFNNPMAIKYIKFILPIFMWILYFYIAYKNITRELNKKNIKLSTVHIMRIFMLSISYLCSFMFIYTLMFPFMFNINNEVYFGRLNSIAVLLVGVWFISYFYVWSYPYDDEN